MKPVPFVEDINPRKTKIADREVILRVDRYAGEGMCIAYEEGNNEGKIVFARYVLPGERIRAKIYRETKDYAMADPLEWLETSPQRQHPPCPYFAFCGGCDYQMLEYKTQLEVKKNLVLETFARVGKFQNLELTGIIESPEPFYYRNTETFKVNERKRLIGFFRKDTKFIVDIEKCMLAMPGINEALSKLRHQDPFPPHNFKVRTTVPWETVVHWVRSPYYEDKPVYEVVKAAGKEFKFKISKDSFFQVNTYVIPLWLEKIISFLAEDKHERIFDLYCGIGLITLFVGEFAKETIGVEVQKASVEDAWHNLHINGIQSKIEFIQASVDDTLEKLGYADVMIIDPPRKGMDPHVIEVLRQMQPEKIIYSSCKPATMARDIRSLSDMYHIDQLWMVDMFPQTHHIEMLALLRKK